jgi:hypothetical protein
MVFAGSVHIAMQYPTKSDPETTGKSDQHVRNVFAILLIEARGDF